MAVLMNYLFLFVLGAMGGWVMELLFRRIFSAKKWINPGFMHGPYLPIYGFGVCVMYAISGINLSFINGMAWELVIRGVVTAVLLTFMEYVGGLVFIKAMKVKLWDYSRRPGNIQGIICPLFTVIWGVAGVAYYLLCYEPFEEAIAWFNTNYIFLFVMGIVYGVIIVDFCMSIHLATKLRKALEGSNIVVHYENMKLAVRLKKQEFKEKYNFLVPIGIADIKGAVEKLKEGGSFDNLKEIIAKRKKKDYEESQERK